MNQIIFLSRNTIFSTREFAVSCAKNIDSASRLLTKLARDGAIVKVTRGIWAQPQSRNFTHHALIPHLLGTEQGYLSFLSAMHLHGLITQIPGSIQIATTGHGRRLRSPVGEFEFIQIKPAMMRHGITTSETVNHFYPMATVEKALLDTLYIATRRGNRFASLPEVDWARVDLKLLNALMANQIEARPIYSAVGKRLVKMAPGFEFRATG